MILFTFLSLFAFNCFAQATPDTHNIFVYNSAFFIKPLPLKDPSGTCINNLNSDVIRYYPNGPIQNPTIPSYQKEETNYFWSQNSECPDQPLISAPQENNSAKYFLADEIIFPQSNTTKIKVKPRVWTFKYDHYHDVPIIENDELVVRNENTVYAFSLNQRRPLWNISPLAHQGTGQYKNAPLPFHNEQNNSLAIDKNGSIYLQVADYFFSLDQQTKKVLWKKLMAQYRPITKPIISPAGNIILGVKNERGEIWFIGISSADGQTVWSTYAGISNHTGPVSDLIMTVGDCLIAGTNHGFIIALNSRTGAVYWLRKYPTFRYNLFDFFLNITSETIAFQGHFLEHLGKDLLAYKAYESSSLQLISLRTGALVREFQQPKDELFLGLQNNHLLSLTPNQVKEYNLDNFQVDNSFARPSKTFKTAFVFNHTNYLQFDTDLYYWSTNKLKQIDGHFQGDVIGANANYIITADSNKYSLYKKEGSTPQKHFVDLQTSDNTRAESTIGKATPCFGSTKSINGVNLRLISPENRENDLIFWQNADQIIASDKQGIIRWQKKILDYYERPRYVGRPAIWIYTLDNIVLIEDSTSFIAFRKHDGLFLWTKGKDSSDWIDFDDIMVPPPSLSQCLVFNNRIFIKKDNAIQILNPLTGEVIEKLLLKPRSHIISHYVDSSRLYIATNWNLLRIENNQNLQELTSFPKEILNCTLIPYENHILINDVKNPFVVDIDSRKTVATDFKGKACFVKNNSLFCLDERAQLLKILTPSSRELVLAFSEFSQTKDPPLFIPYASIIYIISTHASSLKIATLDTETLTKNTFPPTTFPAQLAFKRCQIQHLSNIKEYNQQTFFSFSCIPNPEKIKGPFISFLTYLVEINTSTARFLPVIQANTVHGLIPPQLEIAGPSLLYSSNGQVHMIPLPVK